jgi:hypothetical protein
VTRRTLTIALVVSLIAVAAISWIGSHTYWGDIEVPVLPKGEARANPTYAAQHFVERLGGHATRDGLVTIPPPNDVIVLSVWNWGLIPERAARLERWVEAGGRLVLDATVSVDDEFSQWSGVTNKFRGMDSLKAPDRTLCRKFDNPAGAARWFCDFNSFTQLETGREPEWFLREKDAGIQAVRVRVGAGTVSVINGDPFRYRALFDGDHGWLLVTAAGLRRGDTVHFLTENESPSLLALTWQYGGPVIVVLALVVALALWRDAVRFGPLETEPARARRSLAEQIRGTGSFVFRHGGGAALHEATVKALQEAARRRIPGYATLSVAERTAALAALTGLSPDALAEAMFHPESHRQEELPGTVTLLETARRRVLLAHTAHTKVAHGTS